MTDVRQISETYSRLGRLGRPPQQITDQQNGPASNKADRAATKQAGQNSPAPKKVAAQLQFSSPQYGLRSGLNLDGAKEMTAELVGDSDADLTQALAAHDVAAINLLPGRYV